MLSVNVGLNGEFKYQIIKSDEIIKDSDWQKNVITNNGMAIMGRGYSRSTSSPGHYQWMQYQCAVGTGNNEPLITDSSLTSEIAKVTSNTNTDEASYADDDSGYYKVSRISRYDFTDVAGNNITELGLKDGSNVLCTHALIKDTEGNPTTIQLQQDEVLVVYYKVTAFWNTADSVSMVNMLDGKGGSEPYKVTMRLAYVGGFYKGTVGRYMYVPTGDWGREYARAIIKSAGDLLPITATLDNVNKTSDVIWSKLNDESGFTAKIYFGSYDDKNYRRYIHLRAGIRDLNTDNNIAYVMFYISGCIAMQIKFESVADGSGIPKTDQHKLNVPMYVQWGRM